MRESSADACRGPSADRTLGDITVNNDELGHRAYSAVPILFKTVAKVHQEVIWLFPYS
jgi:hypothetical protein